MEDEIEIAKVICATGGCGLLASLPPMSGNDVFETSDHASAVLPRGDNEVVKRERHTHVVVDAIAMQGF